MQEYYNFKEGLNSKGKLMTLDQLSKYEKDPNKDYYISIYKYNEEQKKRVDQKGTISGIKDVTTDILVWDFDSSTNPELARQDTVTLAHRLVNKYNVDPDSIQCYYSGSKGFHVVLYLGTKQVNPEEFKKATTTIAEGLKTFDVVVSDPARVIRMEYTKHPKTGLFKIPLHISEVDEMSMDNIKDLAKTSREDMEFSAAPVALPEVLFKAPEKKKEPVKEMEESSKPPKGWKEYKWSIAGKAVSILPRQILGWLSTVREWDSRKTKRMNLLVWIWISSRISSQIMPLTLSRILSKLASPNLMKMSCSRLPP